MSRQALAGAESRAASGTGKKSSSQFVGFQIAGQAYAFRIEQIQEIVILDRVTKTPQVPDYVEGVSNLRGSIIPIINLRRLLGLEPKAADGETRTIVVNVGQRTMGCTVDTVSQVMRIPEENIQPAPETVTAGAGYISGFARQNGALIILLEIDELLDPKKLEQVNQAALRESGRATSGPRPPGGGLATEMWDIARRGLSFI